MFTFSIILIFANLLFLALGASLYMYAEHIGFDIPAKTDQLFPSLALEYMPAYIGIAFLIGLIAAAYSSADSALTSLTTTFCIDFLDFEKSEKSETAKRRTRLIVHLCFSLLLLIVVVLTKILNAGAIINELFKMAGYTYGPLLGLFSFGILTNRSIRDQWIIPICILSPIVSYILVAYSDTLFGGFQFGSTIIALNGFLTFVGLLFISKNRNTVHD